MMLKITLLWTCSYETHNIYRNTCQLLHFVPRQFIFSFATVRTLFMDVGVSVLNLNTHIFSLLFLIHQRYQVVKIGKTDDRYEEKAFRFIEIVTYRKTGNWQWGHGVTANAIKQQIKHVFLQIYKSTATSCNIVIKHKHGDKLEIRCSEWAKQ